MGGVAALAAGCPVLRGDRAGLAMCGRAALGLEVAILDLSMGILPVMGLGLIVESIRRRREPIAWGLGRWTIAISTARLGVGLVEWPLIQRVQIRMGTPLPSGPWSIFTHVRDFSLQPTGEFLVAAWIASLWATGHNRVPGRADLREWAGRRLAAGAVSVSILNSL